MDVGVAVADEAEDGDVLGGVGGEGGVSFGEVVEVVGVVGALDLSGASESAHGRRPASFPDCAGDPRVSVVMVGLFGDGLLVGAGCG